jgi:hypothetical protein
MAQKSPKNEVIILNKPLIGTWLDKEGNIGHEIIDFLEADDGNHYVYNNPWGVCPDDIWVEPPKGTTGTPNSLTPNANEKYVAKYLVLTGPEHGKNFEIRYVIELTEKLHREHSARDENSNDFVERRKKVIQGVIQARNIRYNGKLLSDIYPNDKSLLVTFKAGKMWKAKRPISVTPKNYNFKRNKGYLYSDQASKDYSAVSQLIDDSIKDGRLILFHQRNLKTNPPSIICKDDTFMNLIRFQDTEKAYTNILYSVLSQGTLMKDFCNNIQAPSSPVSAFPFSVFREKPVNGGRIDVCAESDDQRVIIENKVLSGLNGIDKAKKTTQLSTYYNVWGIEKKNPLCFVVAPDFRKKEIINDIKTLDSKMGKVYSVITYGQIADFINAENKQIPSTYRFYSLLLQIESAFRNLSYKTKEELYAGMFYQATL